MGCTTSKHARKRAMREDWSAPITRSMSMPVHHRAEKEGDSYHVVCLTSSSYGILKTEVPGYDRAAGRSRDLLEDAELSTMSISDVKKLVESMKLMPVKEEEDESRAGLVKELETINTWELMEGLEDDGRSPSPMKRSRSPSPLQFFESGKRKLRNRSVSFHTVQDVDSYFAKIGPSNFSVWRKYLQDDDFGKENVKPRDGSLLHGVSPKTPPRQPFCSVSPINRLTKPGPESRSFSCAESGDAQTGLRLLLSPASESVKNNSSPCGRTSLSFDGDMERLYNDFSRMTDGSMTKSPLKSPNVPSPAGMRTPDGLEGRSSPVIDPCLSPLKSPNVPSPAGMRTPDGLKGRSSPLFDPSLLATFEQALEDASEDDWQTVDPSVTSSSNLTSSSSDTSSDADSPHLKRAEDIPNCGYGSDWACQENRLSEEKGNALQPRADGVHAKRLSYSKVSPVDFVEKDWKKRGSVESFQPKCPPGGAGKAVLYFTSLRGVRKTYEDCCSLRLILQGLGVHVDERDVWMHSKFRQEVSDLLGKACPVPRLFIKGRYIGGADEAKQLHEEGILAELLEGLPSECLRKACDGCGDVRFIPCLTCSGSCKLINEANEVARCPECNENGLIMCPICS